MCLHLKQWQFCPSSYSGQITWCHPRLFLSGHALHSIFFSACPIISVFKISPEYKHFSTSSLLLPYLNHRYHPSRSCSSLPNLSAQSVVKAADEVILLKMHHSMSLLFTEYSSAFLSHSGQKPKCSQWFIRPNTIPYRLFGFVSFYSLHTLFSLLFLGLVHMSSQNLCNRCLSCLEYYSPVCSMSDSSVLRCLQSLLNSCPSNWSFYLTISPSAAPFSFCHQSFSASGSLSMSQFFA